MSSKFDIYKEINDKVLEAMSQGIIPWQKPWSVSEGALSHYDGKPYSLLNQMLLQIQAAKQGREENSEYITFLQIKAEGGKIKKGEKANMIVFWKHYVKEYEEDGEKKTKVLPILRYYHVFEVSQCEGIKRKFNNEERVNALSPIEAAEQVVNDYYGRESCILRIEESQKAYYDLCSDVVVVPQLSQYQDAEAYYSTLFHETIHSTGFHTRLDRDMRGTFGSGQYSKEELVAELGSMYLCNKCGIDTSKVFKNSVAYLQSWMRALENDSTMFVSAAGKAERAVKFVLTGEKQEQ